MEKNKGFTLIELLVVIAIIAVLSVIGFATFSGLSTRANDARRKGDIDAYSKAYEIKFSNANSYPISGLSGTDFSSGQVPKDPRGDNYFNVVTADGSGFKVCAALQANSETICNSAATNCYCKTASLGTNNLASGLSGNANLTGTSLGWGISGSSSCDSNGTLTGGLVAYWNMNDSSNLGKDLIGSNNLTNNAGVSSGAGKSAVFGASANFLATSSQYLSIASNASVQTGNVDYTITAWVRFDTLGRRAIITKDNSPNREFDLYYETNAGSCLNKFKFDVFSSTDVQSSVCSSHTLAAINTWYFVAIRYNSAEAKQYITIDDTYDSFLSTVVPAFDSSQPLKIGGPGYVSFMDGSIDDVRFYKRFLSNSELSTLYYGGAGCIP